MAAYSNIRIPCEIVIPVDAIPGIAKDGLSATVTLVPDFERIQIIAAGGTVVAVPTTDPVT